MKSLPLPFRVAAGLAVTAVEHARDLPAKLAGLPVTVASQALQLSMRVQQQVTELAIKGDEVLAGLRPVEETPAWATFDEDVEENRYDASRPAPFDQVVTDWADIPADTSADTSHNGHREPSLDGDETELDAAESDEAELDTAELDEADPWAMEERALAEEPDVEEDRVEGPGGLTNYDELSLPQLRARLRRFTVEELEELLDYERAHGNRPAFVGMLSRRIATVRDQP
jgi:hypothetical protein